MRTRRISSSVVIMGNIIRTHCARLPLGRRPQDGTDLRDEELRMLERKPDRTPAHERVRLAGMSQIGNRLVAPQIQRANRHLWFGLAAMISR